MNMAADIVVLLLRIADDTSKRRLEIAGGGYGNVRNSAVDFAIAADLLRNGQNCLNVEWEALKEKLTENGSLELALANKLLHPPE
ncbi:hypothetical protein SprV_0401515400 [Sparganum proliferum]